MATVPMRSILTLLFTFAVCCNCQSVGSGVSSSWAKLQISPDTLTSMEYGNFLVEIYEHANNRKVTASEKKYFYSPIALLDYKNATSRLNNITKKPEMRFSIEMWNDKVQNEVVKHLKKIVGKEIQSDKVRVIPFEKVILKSNIPTTDYSLSSAWTIYDKSKTLWCHLFCDERKVCDELAKEMRSDPTQFYHFKLLYSLSSQTSQTKQTTISIGSVTSSQMVSNLLQKYKDKKEIFLTANDEKKMLTETATNIRMEILDDSEVVSPDTESQILNILTDLLVVSRTAIKDQSDKMWDSVFWNEDNYRPDKTTKTLNEIIKKLDKETQKKLVDLFQKAERQSEITEKLTSSNKDEEKRREKQLRSENQSKEAKEKEIRTSQATEATEKSENAKKSLDEHNRNLGSKERILHNYDANSWADVDRISLTISGKMAKDSDSSRRVENLKEEVKKLLQESRDNVQWDGEKFVPKPMNLSRINLGKFRDSQSFQGRNVRVRYTTAELFAPIKFMDHAGLTVTDEWNNLKDELRETRELLDTTIMNLAKTNIELGNVKRNLTNTKIDLTNKLEDLASARTELSNTKSAVLDLTTKLNARTNEIVDIGKMPTSCLDLERMGQKVSGFFSVKGAKMMETVYCDFYSNRNAKEKWIGYADVKSAHVHFYVQRKVPFNTIGIPIPFEVALVNEGNAMNLSSGKFTAPRRGIYFFSFTGIAEFPEKSLHSHIKLFFYSNDSIIGYLWIEESTHGYQRSPGSLQFTLSMKKGDQVWVAITELSDRVYLFGKEGNTYFTGFLLQEEIVASL